jgi:hypothetical protein
MFLVGERKRVVVLQNPGHLAATPSNERRQATFASYNRLEVIAARLSGKYQRVTLLTKSPIDEAQE